MKLYKILVDGKSCHGGDLKWNLPKKKGNKWILTQICFGCKKIRTTIKVVK